MSLLSAPSTASQSLSACMIARWSAYAYFLEMVAGRSGVDVEKGRQDRSLWDTVFDVLKPAPLAISGGNGKAVIANHLHDHVDHVSIRKQLQQLAGEAAVPYGVVSCCEVDLQSSGFLFS